MDEVALAAQARHEAGSRPARRLRALGKVPGVLYGHGIEAVPLAVGERELRGALSTPAGVNALLTLDVEGTSHLAMARQLQRHPVRGSVIHVDFVIVRRDEVVTTEVPVQLVGEAAEVHKNDGLIEQSLFALTISAKPADIPPGIEVDVSALVIGDSIRVSDLQLPAGVTTDVDPDSAVVVAQMARVVELPEEAVEGEEAEEGEEGAAEGEAAASEGEAPAAEGESPAEE